MGETLVRFTLCGLLLALVTSRPNKDDWDIYSFHINSTVTSRYATTVITSRVVNRMDQSKEIEFHVRIPNSAFISKFKMLIDGREYDGVVKAKEEAQRQYADAVSRGESAGIVSSVGRTLEDFKTSVTVAAHKKITFELTYEELLKRRLGKYELQIYARPMQPVRDFKVDVHIAENAGISFLDVKGGLNTNDLANAVDYTAEDKEAWVYFYPTVDQQKTCGSCGPEGLNGDLVVVYDVNRNHSLGDIKISNGYFVHHFAPAHLTRLSKNVVFLIDQSGSMYGRKIEQTRWALIRILDDLAEDDYFGLIAFNINPHQWEEKLVQANWANVQRAQRFAENLVADDVTDINSALLEGARMLNANPRQGSASILILLTDGDPTTGETNLESIQSNVKGAIAGKFPLYCLGFGFDVNFEFLERMALQNDGAARRIYEGADASSQLRGFYEEVAVPLLTDVTMVYAGGSNLTQNKYIQYYNGSEIVVAGEVASQEVFLPLVFASSGGTPANLMNTITFLVSRGTNSDPLQRVWAYISVKQLIEKELQLSGPQKDKVKEEALRLSLKYSFVTPLTSMVVTKPTGDNVDVLNKLTRDPAEQTSNTFPGPRKGEGRYVTYEGRKALSGIATPSSTVTPVTIPVRIPPATAAAPVGVRILLKTGRHSRPLCFDLTGGLRLKLLSHPSRGLLVNGQLDSSGGYFSRIKVHIGSDNQVEVDATGVTVTRGQAATRHTAEDTVTVGSVTMILRDKEIDIDAGDTRLGILIHERNGKKNLWPVLRQRAQDPNTEGTLVLRPIYRLMQSDWSASTIIIADGQNVDVTRANAVDYSIVSAPTRSCWRVSTDSSLQRRLESFIVAHL